MIETDSSKQGFSGKTLEYFVDKLKRRNPNTRLKLHMVEFITSEAVISVLGKGRSWQGFPNSMKLKEVGGMIFFFLGGGGGGRQLGIWQGLILTTETIFKTKNNIL